MKINNLIFGMTALILACTKADAQLLNFDFTIAGTNPMAGSISGEIIGLQPDGVSAPSEIILSSFTPTRGGNPGGIFVPLGAFASPLLSSSIVFTPDDFNPSLDVQINVTEEFTVSGGAITAASFFAEDSSHDMIFFDATNGDNQINGADVSSVSIENSTGFFGATYTPVAAPEPDSFTLVLFGLGLAAVYRYRRDDRPFLLK